VADAVAVLEAMAQAIENGEAATRHRGQMIDYAHARTALEVLDAARREGHSVPELPDIDVD
jgi:citrate lyase beta subunit